MWSLNRLSVRISYDALDALALDATGAGLSNNGRPCKLAGTGRNSAYPGDQIVIIEVEPIA